MDERSLEASEKMDELSGGLYFVSDRPDHHDVYDVRKAAAFFRELGLKPGDQLPEEYMEQCLFKEGADA